MSNDHGSRLRDLIDALGKLPRHFQHWQNPDGWIKPQELSALLRASASALSPEPQTGIDLGYVDGYLRGLIELVDQGASLHTIVAGIESLRKQLAALSPSSSPSALQPQEGKDR